MEAAPPTPDAPSAPRPQGLARGTGCLLLCIAAVMALNVLAGTRANRPSALPQDRAPGLADRRSRAAAQQAYALLQGLGSRPGRSSVVLGSARSVDADLWSTALSSRDPNRWVEVAIWRSATGLGDVDEPLLQFRSTVGSQTARERDWESAVWGRLLTAPKLSRDDRRLGVALAEGRHLGWYRSLLDVRLAAASGDPRSLERASREAATPGRLATIPILGMVGLFLAGCALLAHDVWSRIQGASPTAPGIAEALPTTSPAAARFLYGVFVAYLAGYVLLHAALPVVITPALQTVQGSARELLATVIQLFNAAALVAAPLLALRWGFRSGLLAWPDIHVRWDNLRRDALHGITAYLKLIPVLGLVLVVSALVFHGVNTPTNPAIKALAEGGSLVTKIGVVLLASLVAPFCEELLFRGVLLRSLSASIGPRKAVLISALIFAALHPQLPLGFPGLFALGTLFGTLAVRTRSLVPSMVAHALNNTAIVTAVLLMPGQ